MSTDVYKTLAKHLDDLPGGFPATESGVELKILKRLFTPEQAVLAVHCTLIPEDARVVARRAGRRDVDAVDMELQKMARGGLLFSIDLPGRPSLYMAAQYVVGIWEWNVNNLDEELVRLMNEYIPHLMDLDTWGKAPQLRTIPVGRAVDASQAIMAYEQAEELIKEQKKIVVAPCICRTEHKMVGQGCDRPVEACLTFGAGAYYYLKNGMGREIDQDEALEILKAADKAGLVLQPSNAKKVINICCCCGCCCQVLKSAKTHPRPRELAHSAFIAAYDQATCSGCGVCLKRCQMDAFTQAAKKEPVEFDIDRCIGCGLCVSTCPTGSLTLERKPEQPYVPEDMQESALRTARARGKLGPATVAWMGLKSKLDRLMAPKG